MTAIRNGFRQFVNSLTNPSSYGIYLIFAIILGGLVRFHGLGIQSFWLDELYSITASSSSLSKVFELWTRDPHPPLYQFILYIWIHIFGDSEMVTRLLSALAGFLAVFCTYWLGLKVFDKYVSASAAILMAFSQTAIFYSQETRSYSLLLLFSVVSTLLWLMLLKKEALNQKEDKYTSVYIFYIIISITISLIHYYGLVLVFFQLLYLNGLVIFFLKEIRTRVLGLSFLSLLPITAEILIHLNYVARSYWAERPGLNFIKSLMLFVYGNNMTVILLLFIPPILTILLFKSRAKIISHTDELMIKELHSPVFALTYLTTIPLLSLFLLSFYIPTLTTRNCIILLPSFYFLTAWWISLNPLFSASKGCAYVFIVTLLGLLMYLPSYYQPRKEQWREASQYIATNADQNTLLASLEKNNIDQAQLEQGIVREALWFYYLKKFGVDIKEEPFAGAFSVRNDPESMQQLYALAKARGANKIMLFRAHVPAISNESKNTLIKMAKRFTEKNFIKADVYQIYLTE